MEIKKGISQMAEYPNMEINYVVPSDGKMYYVLKDGELKNGSIIATLDPKRAVDEKVLCDSIGVFKEDGSVLIDFNKKDIKKITNDLLLVVNACPISNEVINAQASRNDATASSTLKENQVSIVDAMMKEMGITGSMVFSNPFEEANVYKMDSYNNKVGIDCSFIGKSDKELFFHTNDINTQSTKINYTEVDSLVSEKETPTIDSIPAMNNDIESMDQNELKLDIGSDILDGFQKPESEEEKSQADELIDDVNNKMESTDEIVEEKQDAELMNVDSVHTVEEAAVSENKDQVLDNAIAVMKKMIGETSKLNEKIEKLEKELEEKNKLLEAQESKKNELNSLLTEANEVLENIDE